MNTIISSNLVDIHAGPTYALNLYTKSGSEHNIVYQFFFWEIATTTW